MHRVPGDALHHARPAAHSGPPRPVRRLYLFQVEEAGGQRRPDLWLPRRVDRTRQGDQVNPRRGPQDPPGRPPARHYLHYPGASGQLEGKGTAIGSPEDVYEAAAPCAAEARVFERSAQQPEAEVGRRQDQPRHQLHPGDGEL